MRRVKRWRYYCGFCKKSGGQAAAMERHETNCTMNPNRGCGLCELSGADSAPLSELTAFIDETCKDEDPNDLHGNDVAEILKTITQKAAGCPACILAAIRQAEVKIFPNFDFKKELDAWWVEQNAANDGQDSHW